MKVSRLFLLTGIVIQGCISKAPITAAKHPAPETVTVERIESGDVLKLVSPETRIYKVVIHSSAPLTMHYKIQVGPSNEMGSMLVDPIAIHTSEQEALILVVPVEKGLYDSQTIKFISKFKSNSGTSLHKNPFVNVTAMTEMSLGKSEYPLGKTIEFMQGLDAKGRVIAGYGISFDHSKP